jgi:hypothetical protein
MDMAKVILEQDKLSEEASQEGVEELFGPFADIMRQCEISVILLVLILKPLGYNTNPKSMYAGVFDKYRKWDPLRVQSPVSYISDDLFMLLNAVILTAESRDVEGLRELQKDIWLHLSSEQNDLMNKLLQSSYT